MGAILVRLLPWIAGAASIAGVLLWAQQSGVRLAVHEQTSEQLELVQTTLQVREEQADREWQIIESHLNESQASRARLAAILSEVDELETPDCSRLGADWLRLYNNSNR